MKCTFSRRQANAAKQREASTDRSSPSYYGAHNLPFTVHLLLRRVPSVRTRMRTSENAFVGAFFRQKKRNLRKHDTLLLHQVREVSRRARLRRWRLTLTPSTNLAAGLSGAFATATVPTSELERCPAQRTARTSAISRHVTRHAFPTR